MGPGHLVYDADLQLMGNHRVIHEHFSNSADAEAELKSLVVSATKEVIGAGIVLRGCSCGDPRGAMASNGRCKGENFSLRLGISGLCGGVLPCKSHPYMEV